MRQSLSVGEALDAEKGGLRMDQGREPVELAKVLKAHEDEIENLGEGVIRGDKEKVAGALAGLLTSVSTGSPLLGSWANAAVQKAFVPPATRRLLVEAANYDKAMARDVFIGRIRDVVELLIGQAILQTVRAHHNIKEEILEELGGVREEFEDFRKEFAEGQAQHPGDNLRVQELLVEGGVGVRVSSGARSRMHVTFAKVTNGVGFELN
jgi:hypothetical protein